MKRIFFLLVIWSVGPAMHAQRCLEIRTSALSDLVKIPASAKSSFNDCHRRKADDHGTIEIADYGDNYNALDSFMSQKEKEFNLEASNSMEIPQASSTQINNAKDLAAKMSAMSEEQKKAYAMEMAQQQTNNKNHTNTIQEDPGTIKLIMETADLSGRQLQSIVNEYTDKLKALQKAANEELAKIKEVDKSKCGPVEKTGLPYCACSNKLYEAYWKQKVTMIDKYNEKKIDLYTGYLPKVKAVCVQVDENIIALKRGAAIRTHDYKQKLLSIQAQAFSLANLVIASCEEDVRKTGADLYVNQDNSSRNVYDNSCANQ